MLTGLSIRNIVLIDQLALEFADGLCVLSGETGAGKSILLDALGLALGARADAALVRGGTDSATVAATFEIDPGHPVHAILAENGLAEDDVVILRRAVAADGGSRAFVNDRPTTVAMLRRIGDLLVEVQGQAEHRGLVDPATHRALLDAFGGHEQRVERTAMAWVAWQEARSKEEGAAAAFEQARADEAYLRHALEELEELDPREAEERELAERRSVLMNSEKLIEGLRTALDELRAERDVESRLQTALAMVERVAPLAGEKLAAARDALERAAAETAEAESALTAAGHEIEHDQGDLEEIEGRLFRLRDIARKHKVEVDALPALRAELKERLTLIDDQGDLRERLAKATAAARAAYEKAAQSLRADRLKAARRLDKAMAAELPPLRLEKAVFATEVETRDEGEWGRNGIDRVRFQIATVPGSAPGPLAKVASGGELSRIMLALRVVLAGAGASSSLVFDEVDSGVGGATAAAVGDRLARLSEGLQVLVVTHSPQVAARGDNHLRVDKIVADGGFRTAVAALSDEERQEEIARMLSGQKITAAARAAAASLLAGDAA